jgi:hypothetical protein
MIPATISMMLSTTSPVMGLEGEVGVIAPGKLADIVIWNSDPLADITVLQRPSEISTIIKDGRVVDREAGGFRQLPGELTCARASISGQAHLAVRVLVGKGTDGSTQGQVWCALHIDRESGSRAPCWKSTSTARYPSSRSRWDREFESPSLQR